MCQDDDIVDSDLGNKKNIVFQKNKNIFSKIFVLDKFRNGVETTSQPYTATKTSDQAGKQADVKMTRRLHESWNHYDRCFNRERNKGILNIYIIIASYYFLQF